MLKKYLKMKNNKIIYIAIILSILSLLIYYININHEYILNKYFNINKIDTVRIEKVDTLWRTDTFKIKELIPKEVVKIKTDTVFDKNGDTIQLVTENKRYQDTLLCDKDTAELQIFISGIKSNVDSINLNLKKSEIIKTNTIEITKYIEKKKTFWNRFHLGVQAGYGYGFKSKELTPYVGIGGSIDL